MVFGLFGSVAHELHFCVCAGYRLLICYDPLPVFFFYGFEAAVSAPCGRVANASFLACLSSACSGVWPFRIRCQRASFLCLCRLGGLSATVLYLCFVFTVPKLQFRHRLEGLRTHRFWLRSCSFSTVWKGCERTVFGLPELGLCLAFSDPSPTSFLYVFVQVRLPHVFCPPTAVRFWSLL